MMFMCRKVPTYEECYMRELIAEFLKWKDLQLGDKPDLLTQDHSLGVEIAACIPEEQRKAESLYDRQLNGYISDADGLWLYHYHSERMKKIKNDNDKYIELIEQRVAKKIGKSKNYVQTDEFGLALFTLYNGNIEKGITSYRAIFQKHVKDLDFLILDVANHASLVFVCVSHCFVIPYDTKQYEMVVRAYNLYQAELKKHQKAK
jgi:hypothetical protein